VGRGPVERYNFAMMGDESPNPALERLQKAVRESHEYCRHSMLMWMQWFTFFLTVNYVALGWFAGELARQELKNYRALKEVALMFVSQNLLGIVVCLLTWRYLSVAARAFASEYNDLGLKSPTFPVRFYAIAVLLGAAAMALVIVLWLTFAFGR